MWVFRISSAALCFVFFLALEANKATFHNYQVHRLIPTNEAQLEALRQIEENSTELNFWIEPSYVGKAVDVMVPPHWHSKFGTMKKNMNLESKVYIRNVQNLVDDEQFSTRRNEKFGWTAYHSLDKIYAWLDSLVKSHPAVVTDIIGGKTFADRPIRGVKVSHKQGKPGVFIEAGIHAREWISPATVTYFLNKLLTSNDPVIKDLAQSFDFYIFPCFNPDGYVYTHTTDRMWRKTISFTGSHCIGVDLNRNWGFHWNEIGARSDPCSIKYAGSSSFSEIETRTLGAYITSIAHQFDVYFSFHSYRQLLMFPYGYTSKHISNYNELMELGRAAIRALAKYNGTQYKVGNVHDTVYPASGGSLSWVRGKFGTPYTYIWELRDNGQYGFLLPPGQIIDTAEETIRSMAVILQGAKKKLGQQEED